MRSSGNHKHTTIPEHMPSSHRRYAGWTIERIRADARRIGPATAALCELILESRPHPEQGFRACLGIVRLVGALWRRRVWKPPAERAIDIGARTYGSVKSILDNNLDRHPAPKRATDANADPASQHPWAALLQLGETICSNIPPSTSFTLLASRAWPRLFVEIAASGEADGLGHHEWLALLLDREASWRQDKRLAARLRVAKLRQQACVEDVDYRSPRGLDRALFQKLVEGEWIDAHDNLALIGPTGVGKSWLASALGHKACRDNRSVLYQRAPRLFEDLALARGDGRHPRILRNLGRADLLIIDDWGLEALDAAARHDLLEILEERYSRRSTVITSQLPIDRWHEVIGDPTYADAILDRLIHNAHRIELAGESLRRKHEKQTRRA